MIRSPMWIVSMMLVAGLVAGTTLVYAEQTNSSESVRGLSQAEDDTALVEWHAALSAILETDKEYSAAEKRLNAFDGVDEAEKATLKTALDETYYKVARTVYEDRFGVWEGDDEEFIAILLALDQENVVRQCTDSAIETCGAGYVKKVEVTEAGACIIHCFRKPAPTE